MSILSNWTSRALVLSLLCCTCAFAEDIDIFAGTTDDALDDDTKPNVIFVLDNTSNWSRQSQQWPGGLTQGQSEVRAIKNVLADKTDLVNVGVIEFTTEGNANQNGGFVRHNLQLLNGASQTALNTKIDTIFNNINSPTEKRNSGTEWGNLMYDFYNYLTDGNQSFNGAGTPASIADGSAYSSPYSVFQSPLIDTDTCKDTYLIFIGNPNSSGPTSDDSTNSGKLEALYALAGEQAPNALAGNAGNGSALGMPEFTTTTTTIPGATLGTSSACWKSDQGAACTTAENLAGGLCDGEDACSCKAVSNNVSGCVTRGNPRNRTYHWTVGTADSSTTEVTLSGQVDNTTGANFNLDDWAKYLHNFGIPVEVEIDGAPAISSTNVIVHTIDVFNAKQNAETSSLLYSAADVGGGSYFQARSEAEIESAIQTIFNDILADSASFAAVSLPVSATNRAQVDNEVYIGMFRPSKGKQPRWFGNLKRFQIALFDDQPRLADLYRRSAINSSTGFLRECAASFWTEDSASYWENLGIDPAPKSLCTDSSVSTNIWSDFPDGPFVEKGGAAQMLRNLADSSSRSIYTFADGDIREVTSADAASVGGANVYNYFMGDLEGDGEVMPAAGLRASIHGDVVHSRPNAIRYDADTLRVYYGANDGLLRSVDPSNGEEVWGFVAPEFADRLERLYSNDPLILFSGAINDPNANHAVKDYFFDGPNSSLTVYDEDGELQLGYLYAGMRRGGRMIYAFDITDPDAGPSLLWRKGCPNRDNDTNCSTGFSNVGQSWSTPVAEFVGGYVDGDDKPKPIVAFGGGFDDCLNEDVAIYPNACNSAKGKGIYILDAASGNPLKYLATVAPVITELSPIDIDFDGTMDFAYAADVKGNLYRINFATLSDPNPEGAVTALEPDDWTIFKIGTTLDTTRRFYNAPTAAAFQGTVLVSIGSGDRERPLESNYPYRDSVENRFYVLIDEPYKPFIPFPIGFVADGISTTVDLDGAGMLPVVELGEGDAVPELENYQGWYLDLPDRGEQVANPAAVGGGKVFFNTFQPGGASDGICRKPKGIGTGYTINLFAPEFTEGNEAEGDLGFPVAPVIANLNNVPPGTPDCEGESCDLPDPDDDPCANGGCKDVTICIGCPGFEPVEIIPDAPPFRSRIYFSEDFDRID